ncbi:MAG: hypothetical protein WA584_23330 [Pyrinomonadaceae bacterium]
MARSAKFIIDVAAGGGTFAVVNKLAEGIEDLTGKVVELGVTGVGLAADLQQTTNALEIAAGSTRLARMELAAIDETARNTRGLRLEAAEIGYTRLRNLGFQADASRKLIAGLAKEKIISSADEQAVSRVIVNITQLSAGSVRASQDIKEMIHAMPSLRGVFQDAFGTIDPKRIGKLFADNPDEAVEKFASAMERAKQPATGLNGAIDKLKDAGIEMGRAFGEPILDPLTEDAQKLTGFVRENMDTWRKWGETIADVLRGVSSEVGGMSSGETGGFWKTFFSMPTTEEMEARLEELRKIGREKGLTTDNTAEQTLLSFSIFLNEGMGEPLPVRLNAEGKKIREKALSDQPKLSLGQLRQNDDAEFSKESAAKNEAFWKSEQQKEEAAHKAALELNESFRKINIQQSDGYYKILEAQASSHQDYTTAQELATLRRVSQIRRNELVAQFNIQKKYFDDQYALNVGNEEAIQKLRVERTLTLGKINEQIKLNEINIQKEIQQKEKQIFEQRRAAAIEFKNLSLQSSQFGTDNQLFEAERLLSLSGGTAGFDKLKAVTQAGFEQVRAITREQYALQLQEKSLTEEQIVNIKKKAFLDEQKLTEDNRRKIIKIEEDKSKTILGNIDRFRTQQRRLIGGDIDSGGSFFKDFLLGGEMSGGDFSKQLAYVNQTLESLDKLTQAEVQARAARNVAINENKDPLAIVNTAELWEKADTALTKFKENNPNYGGFEAYTGILDQLNKKNYETIEGFEKLQKSLVFSDFYKEFIDINQELSDLYEKRGKAVLTDPTNKILLDSIDDSIDLKLKALAGVKASIASAQQAITKNSITGTQDYIANTSPYEKARIVYLANQQIWQSNKETWQNIIALESGYYKNSENWELRQKQVKLEAIREVWEADKKAIEERIRAQVKLDDANNLHSGQIKARVLGHLAEQKSLSETIGDEIISVYDKATSGIDKLLDKAMLGKIPILGGVVKHYAQSALSSITRNILGDFGGIADKLESTGDPKLDESKKQSAYLKQIEQNTRGGAAGAHSISIGGVSIPVPKLPFGLGSVFQNAVFGGGQNSGLFSGNQGGGIFSLAAHVPKLLGIGTGIGSAAIHAAAAPALGSLFGAGAAGLGGAALGAGLGGGTAAAGASAAAGLTAGGSAGLIALASNPFTIAAAVGIGGILLARHFGLFGESAEKKLKKAAQSAFGVNVKDKNVLKQLKAIGESSFGKGQAGKRASDVVQLEQSKNLLREYAEQTGQSSDKLDGDEFFSESNPNNQYTSAPVSLTSKIRSSYSDSADASAISASVSASRSSSNSDGAMVRQLMQMVNDMTEMVGEFTGRVKGMSPGEVLAIGANDNPGAIADAYEGELDKNPHRSDNFRRLTNS